MAVVITREPKLSPAAAVYGNVAYDLSYVGGGAAEVQLPGRFRRPEPAVLPREREQERVRSRPQVRVRKQQRVSLFAVGGFMTVLVCAVVILLSYVQLIELSNQVVFLRSELTELRSEEGTLLMQYEQAFDLTAVEEAVTAGGMMAKPRTDQVYYVDMSEPDNAVVYGSDAAEDGYQEALTGLRNIFSRAVEYFR